MVIFALGYCFSVAVIAANAFASRSKFFRPVKPVDNTCTAHISLPVGIPIDLLLIGRISIMASCFMFWFPFSDCSSTISHSVCDVKDVVDGEAGILPGHDPIFAGVMAFFIDHMHDPIFT